MAEVVSARDVESVRFSKPPIGKRGYNEDEVDAFLDLVAPTLAEYEELAREYDDLKARENRQMLAPAPDQPAPIQFQPAPPPPAAQPQQEPPTAAAMRILALAEQTAEELRTEAESTAASTKRDAEEKSAVMLSEARTEAARVLDAARVEAAQLNNKIAELREFEKNYRGRLLAYITGQADAIRADALVEPPA